MNLVSSTADLDSAFRPAPGNKLIYLVRHAQGFHNLSAANHTMPDPLLTDEGKSQCTALSTSFPLTSTTNTAPNPNPSILLAASPLRRTIYTALNSFPTLLHPPHNLTILAIPDAQETSDVPCDTGSAPSLLRPEFASFPVDLSLVHDGWNSKSDLYAPDPESLRNRALRLRRYLHSRPEDIIVLVTHGGFLHYLTEDWVDFEPALGTGWRNCEWRAYEFRSVAAVDGTGEDQDSNATIVETRASRGRREGATATATAGATGEH